MNKYYFYKVIFSILLFLQTSNLKAQTDIFQLMERTDLSLPEIEQLAEQYFLQVGTEKGSGYKQYQRWLYERKFHTNENGYLIPATVENSRYQTFKQNSGLALRGSIVWTELGPKSWTYTSSWNPGVGRLTSVAVHPSDTTIIYVSSPGGGIWKSTNNGVNWTPLIDFVNSSWMNIFHLCIDPNNPNTIYASVSSGGVIKSINGGATWAATGAGPNGAKQVKVHPTNSNIVFAAAGNGIYRSVNGGTSWTNVHGTGKEDIEFNPANPNTMYASGSSGTSCVWRSVNNGINWTAVDSISGITKFGRTLLAVSPANPAVVYAVQASGSVFGRLYKSVDSGVTFITTVIGNAANKTNFFGYNTDGSGTTGQATYDMAVCVNPLDAEEIHIAGCICFKSVDGGYNFTATTAWSYPNTTGYNHSDVHALEWVKSTIYSGSDGGIFKSYDNADSWNDFSATLGIKQYYRISCSKTDPNIITGGAQDNGSTYRRSNGQWFDWLGADGMDNAISPTNPAIAIGTSQNGSIYKTVNSGASYSGLPKPSNGNWVTPIVMHPTNHDTIYGGWTGVWRSKNGGSSWDTISPKSFGTIDVLAVAPSNTKYIYAAKGSTLWRTADGGLNWTSIIAPASVTSIFVSKNNPAKIWITCNSSTNRVYTSTNQGTSLTNLSTGLPSIAARSVVVDEDSIETVYVGMNLDVYFRDTSNTWKIHASGLPLVAINEIEIQKSSNKLRVATYGRGVWQSDLQNIPPVCNAPLAFAVSNITASSVLLSWKNEPGALSYAVEYKQSSSPTWIVLNTALTDTFYNITGLNDSTSYDCRVRTNCPALNSIYVNTSFTTIKNCANPAGFNVVSKTSSSVVLSWNLVPNVIDYTVDYKLVSAGTWNSTPGTNQNTISITGLTPGDYQYRVKANCGASSGAFSLDSFTIVPDCNNPTGLKADITSPSSINLNWNAVSGANTYQVDYKLKNKINWTSTPGTSNNYLSVTGLAAGDYDWRIKAKCTPNESSFVMSSFVLNANIGIDNKSIDYLPIALYPNPAQNNITFKLSPEGKTKFQISILDMLGKELYRKTMLCNKGVNELQIDLSSFSNGKYSFNYSSENFSGTKLFSIQR